MIKRSIGQNLREIRKAKEDQGLRITQKDVAAAMGVRDKQVSKWENDEVQLSADQIVRLADFYGISTDELLRGGKAENLVMMNETGLSDQTIDLLRESKTKGKKELAEMINLLCDTRYTPHKLLPASGELLLSAMYDFISCEKKDVYKSPSEGGRYVSSLDQIYLLRIIKELNTLRDDYQKDRDQKTGSEDQEREVVILENTQLF